MVLEMYENIDDKLYISIIHMIKFKIVKMKLVQWHVFFPRESILFFIKHKYTF